MVEDEVRVFEISHVIKLCHNYFVAVYAILTGRSMAWCPAVGDRIGVRPHPFVSELKFNGTSK